MKGRSQTVSYFTCTECNSPGIPIPRNWGRKRKDEHLKMLWCVHCKKEVNHLETNSKSITRTLADLE